MSLSRFFIDRPIFASVLSILITIAGAIAIPSLPISEYPEVVPPSIVVRAIYPGANPRVIGETVASPLEEVINGVENMLYMSSNSTADGVMTLTVTFAIGTDVDLAQVQVQNRVSQALPRLPEEVRTLGVTTVKSSPDLTMVVHLVSPDGRYDDTYLRNFALIRVRDVLARLPGMGQVRISGAGDYAMRLWLDPDKLASRGLAAGDVVRSVREQNLTVAAGVVGGPPTSGPVAFQLAVNARGRLVTEEEFGAIILKRGADGALTHLRDVARVELAAGDYSLRSLLTNQSAVAIPIFQAPGSNALALSQSVRETMASLKQGWPDGVDYSIVYDPTVFVRQSIESVVETLLEAILLVVIVVIVFLQTWRASIIPLLAVPVSIVGTFAVMLAAGFSINTLSLFGMVLAIGIVVDDAIVVVENVERNIELGFAPKEAARRAMDEVSGPILAIALVLCAIFVPIAFVSGLTGQFYRQFALTIAISTVISAFNSLTLSPALAAILLKPHGAPPDAFQRGIDRLLGWFFRPFNRFFTTNAQRYERGVGRAVARWPVALALYAGLLALAWVGLRTVPAGFIPTQDKGYLVAIAQLPDGASIERTDKVVRQIGEIAKRTPGVAGAVQFPGLSVNGFVNAPNAGLVFIALEDFERRPGPAGNAFALVGQLNAAFSQIQDAFVAVFPPPPVQGLGTVGGFKLEVEDRASLGEADLFAATQALLGAARQRPELAGLFSPYTVGVPQLFAEVDREQAKRQGVALTDLFQTMQVYLGSAYINDFNRFGRTYQVLAQADAPFRASADRIRQLQVRNAEGRMVPLGALMTIRETNGPDRITHYNAYPAAEVNGGPAPGVSSGQAQAIMAQLARETLPNGIEFEWTELAYQQIISGNTAVLIFPLCILLAFLVLAAQYESWSLPIAVVLIVPLSVTAAIGGIWATGGDNNIFVQVGFFVLAGLACKNAILIVEFARELQLQGRDAVSAALESCRLRLRPILMTSFAFIMGVVPLIRASGAGSEVRRAMGIAVFSGMLGVTIFGLVLTPVFYVLVQRLAGHGAATPAPAPAAEAPHA